MKAIILAGGRGTRLQSVIMDLPKTMADINGTPFLELIMKDLLKYGVSEFILCVSYLKESIINHFGDSFHDVPIRYAIEHEPLGTGGAIKHAFEIFGIDRAVVLNGDTFVQMDFSAFYEKHKHHQLAVALSFVENASRYGQVQTREDKIISFCEKGTITQPGFINAGVYLINKSLFQGDLPLKFSFEKEILENMAAKGNINFFKAGDYFIDIGIPESYARACRELRDITTDICKNKVLF